MRRIALIVGAVGLLGWGITAALGGCGGDEGGVATPTNDAAAKEGSATMSSSSSSGESSSSSSSGESSGGMPEGGTTSSGAPAATPFKITCGAAECDAGAGGGGFGNGGFCCKRDGGTNPVCLGGFQANQCDNSLDQNTLQQQCEETPDCPKANGSTQQLKCCLSTRNGEFTASCQSNCRGGGGNPATQVNAQVCKADSECSDGGANQPTCNEKTCRGFKIRVCGTPENCQ